jgi:hypothetical protein
MMAASADGAREQAVVALAYDAGEDTEFCLYKSYIVKCARDSFYLFNRDGEVLFNKNIEFTKPALTHAGDYLLVYDMGGRSAFVMEDKIVKWDEKFSNNIINASINKDGYIAIVTEASGYRNSVKIIASLGRGLFDWVVADDYIISANISEDSGQFMVNRIKTSGISVRSGLEFIDIKSEPFAAIESDEGKVILRAFYIGDNNFCAATDTEIKLYSSSREIISQESFDAVRAVCEFPQRSCAVAAQLDGENVIISYGLKKQRQELLKTEAPVVNMCSSGDLLVVNTGRQVIAVSGNGRVKSSIYMEAEILYADIYDKSHVLIVTERRAELYRIK